MNVDRGGWPARDPGPISCGAQEVVIKHETIRSVSRCWNQSSFVVSRVKSLGGNSSVVQCQMKKVLVWRLSSGD